MDWFELLAALEEGLENGRISPQTAAYIAAELFGIDADVQMANACCVPPAPG